MVAMRFMLSSCGSEHEMRSEMTLAEPDSATISAMFEPCKPAEIDSAGQT
jgi:hypothetical protein